MILFIGTIVFFMIPFTVEKKIYLFNTQDGLSVEYYDCIDVGSLAYCRRPEAPITLTRDNDHQSCPNNGGTLHHFGELRSNKTQIGEILYQWKSSIERVEDYSLYLNHWSTTNGSLCQCLRPSSFGKNCEYQVPFGTTIEETLHRQLTRNNDSQKMLIHNDIICYNTLQCDSGLLCLDWREVCDGIQQCMSGFDEENCDLLEMNICEDDEYRCMNGMCIPDEYFLDGEFDCLDWSDEIQFMKSDRCGRESASIRCDDHVCLPNEWSCGDGQCIRDRFAHRSSVTAQYACYNRRDEDFMCEISWKNSEFTMRDGRCVSYGHHEIPRVKNMNEEERCEYSLRCALAQGQDKGCLCSHNSTCIHEFNQSCSLPSIQYPKGAILAPFIVFFYNLKGNRTLSGPDFVLINGTVRCRNSLMYALDTIPFEWQLDVRRISEGVFCNRTNNISSVLDVYPPRQCDHSEESSNLCDEWNPCMPNTRINDGIVNCLNGKDEDQDKKAETLRSCLRVRRHRFRCSTLQVTCLSVVAFGNEKKDCENNFDELWFGTRQKVFDMNCNDRWKDECDLLRQYIDQSSGSINDSKILFPVTIPFRSYCDTFWNLDSREDENVAECRQWWTCAEGQWQCRTGQCVNQRWRSDLETDCGDASDEQETFDFVAKQMQKQAALISTCGNALVTVSNTSHSTGLFFCLSSRPSHQRIVCINQNQLGDNRIDCAGAMDETNTLQHCSQPSMLGYSFRCPSTNTCIPYYQHCQPTHRCPNSMDDAHWCDRQDDRPSNCSGERDFVCFDGQCLRDGRCNGTLDCPYGEDEYTCDYPSSVQRKIIPYRQEKEALSRTTQRTFRLPRFPIGANITESSPDSVTTVQTTTTNVINETSPVFLVSAYRCNRGIGILSINDSIVCSCPPQYYGDRCQYHADRLLVFLQLDLSQSGYTTESDSRIILKLLILFLFNKQILMTHEFHVRPALEISVAEKKMAHLLHSKSLFSRYQRMDRYINRSSLLGSQPYSTRIEVYESNDHQIKEFVGVWQYPIHLDNLPVFQLSKILRLTKHTTHSYSCSNHPNEECRTLMNNQSKFLRLCKANFGGENCSVEDERCTNGHCAPGSLCKPNYHGLLRGNPLPYCLCPFHWFGDRCGIQRDVCRPNPCQNGASCAPRVRINQTRCFCTKEYHGPYCEWKKSGIRLFVNQNYQNTGAVVIQFFDLAFTSIDLSLVHQQVHRSLPPIIEYDHDQKTVPAIVLAKIYFSSDHKIPVKFYLLSLLMNVTFIDGRTEMTETNRCPDVHTFSNVSSPIHYHHLCRENRKVFCFRDENYLCICVDNQTRVECFRYDHQLDHCSRCLSGGRCLQGDRTRPTDFVCLCPSCYSGRQCQFSSSSFTFNLDQLFHADLTSPSKETTIAFLIALPSLGFLFAVPNNLFSFVTLRRRSCLRNGIGHYLLCLSVINQITLTLLFSRLVHLSLTASMLQSSPAIDGLFCKIFSYFLICCIRLANWLSSFVSLERVYTAIYLNKRWLKQPRIARRLMVLIFAIVFFSSIYELAFIQSFSDGNDSHGSMCLMKFPLTHQSMWIFIHQLFFVTHLLMPLLINIGCTFTIAGIVIKTKMNLRGQKQCNGEENRDRREVLREVLNENKELIARPAITLIPSIFSLFTLPLFFIGFSLQCSELESSPFRYLLVTFFSITFIPPMITFILYIYPSSFYWKEWQATTISKWLSSFSRQQPSSIDSALFSTIREQRTRDFSQVPKKDG